jgi:hypothetical protein
MLFVSQTLLFLGAAVPFGAAVMALRANRKLRWLPILLAGSSIISWFFLIGADQAYYESLRLDYELTKDPTFCAVTRATPVPESWLCLESSRH